RHTPPRHQDARRAKAHVPVHGPGRRVGAPSHRRDWCGGREGGGPFAAPPADAAKDIPRRPVFISGAAQAKPACSDDLCNRPDMFEIGLTRAAPRAFAMAGMTPADMDGAMIYDCFTYVALLELEEAGFCPRGEGG